MILSKEKSEHLVLMIIGWDNPVTSARLDMKGDILAHKVKVYGTSTCPWCTKAKRLLQENNIVYEDIDITRNKEEFEIIINETGWMTVPVIDIDGELAAGFSEKWIKQKLDLD